ncbi:sensor histidine kinase [Bacillus timonensis]|nr:sensor histidine kinase [Bacillus timonensis]
MFTKIESIRISMVKSHLVSAVVIGMLFFIGLQLILLTLPSNTLGLTTILLLTLFVFLISAISGVYIGYKYSQPFKKRLEDIATFITVLERGNLKTRLEDSQKDEVARITQALNQLALKIENHVQSLQRLADEKTKFAEKAHTAAVIEERQRLARDLHDAVSQQLFALNMMSSATSRIIESNPSKSKEMIEQIAHIASAAQVEMRALLLHLRPVHLGRDQLHDGLLKLIEELKDKCPIDFQTKIEDIQVLTKGTEDHLFRIVQEAIANILRHADASIVKVELYQKEHHVYLHIRDNGKGFNVKEKKLTSYGLQTMKERSDEIGGSFTIQSKEREGTYISIKVPI